MSQQSFLMTFLSVAILASGASSSQTLDSGFVIDPDNPPLIDDPFDPADPGDDPSDPPGGGSEPGSDTILRLVTPDNPVTNPIDDIQITASAIDIALGTQFFSVTAEGLFDDVAALRGQLRQIVLEEAIQSGQLSQIDSVTVDFDPLAARLLQFGSFINVEVSGLTTELRARASSGIPLLCGTVRFTALIDSRALGRFDAFTGALDNPDIRHNINVTEASCSGVFGFLGNILADIFIGGIDGQIESQMKSALDNALSFNDLPGFFSVKDMTADLIAAIPSNAVAFKVQGVANHIFSQVEQSGGLRLDIELRPDFNGAGAHMITLTASQERPQVFAQEQRVSGVLIDITGAPSNLYEIYYWDPVAAAWRHLTTTSSGLNILPALPNGANRIMVVAESNVVPGMRSFPVERLVEPYHNF